MTVEIETTSPELHSSICTVSTTLQKILQHIKCLKHIGNWREKTVRFVDTRWLLIHSTKPCNSVLLLIFMLPYTFRIHLFAILLWKKNKSCSIYYFAFYLLLYIYLHEICVWKEDVIKSSKIFLEIFFRENFEISGNFSKKPSSLSCHPLKFVFKEFNIVHGSCFTGSWNSKWLTIWRL